jgi:hypothetical protein
MQVSTGVGNLHYSWCREDDEPHENYEQILYGAAVCLCGETLLATQTHDRHQRRALNSMQLVHTREVAKRQSRVAP